MLGSCDSIQFGTPEHQEHHRLNSLKPQFNLGGKVSIFFNSSMASYPVCRGGKASSIFDEEEDDFLEEEAKKRASILEEFTRDEVGAAASSSALSNKFKSSFAREVVQNVRLSMSAHSPDRRRRGNRCLGSTEDLLYSPSALSHEGHDKYDYRRDSDSIKISTLSRRSKSSGVRRTLISECIPSPCSSDESLAWTTHQPLEVDSLLEGHITPTSSSDGCSSSLRKSPPKKKTTSRASLDALKKACMDLDLNLNELDWIGIRNYLSDRDQLSDSFVVNEDFYNAYNYIMSNKRQMMGEAKKRVPKESMKSDSGGEMESCRSSDDEEGHPSGQDESQDSAVHEGSRQSSYSQGRDSVLMDLSQKETELLKLRLDFNVVSEEREAYKKKYESLKAKQKEHDSQSKEIEHLKWQLKTLENSRKTYESATERLMSFLEQVSLVLQSTSPAHKNFIESTRAEVSAIARKTRGRNYSYRSSPSSSLQAISRAESMPSVVHDRLGDASPYSKSSGSIQSLHSSRGGTPDDLAVMTLDRKIKRSFSAQSKSGLPIVDEEGGTYSALALLNASSTLSLSTRKPSSCSTPLKPGSLKKSRKELLKPRDDPPPEVDTSTESEDVIHTYAVSSSKEEERTPQPAAASKEELIREELSKQAVKASTPIYKSFGGKDLNVENSISVDLSPSKHVPGSEDSKDDLRIKAHKMLRSMKCILAREKTLNITPKKSQHTKSPKRSQNRQSLQLLGRQSSFPGLPSFPVLAVSHTSPWNC